MADDTTREPSEAAKRMMTYAQVAQFAEELHANREQTQDSPKATSYSLRGWARHLRADEYRTAADLMEQADDELDNHSRFLRRIAAAYSREVRDQSDAAMLDWAADLEDAVRDALDEFGAPSPDPTMEQQ